MLDAIKEWMMKIRCMLVMLTLLVITVANPFNGGVLAEEVMPVVSLTLPDKQSHIDYLGIDGSPGETFSIADIKTDILLIELFSMYCPYCQAEAPLVNELYDIANAQEEEKGIRIRLIGLGASNTQFEVDHFRDTYKVPFPLFPDKDLSMYKKFGGEGTPGFIACLFKEGEQPVIIVRQSGGFDTAEEFLALMLQRAGFI
jgi:thiol-disulfide isomerase/thioredoxin